MAKIELYTMNHCGYCDLAKRLLQDKGLNYTEHNVSLDDALRIALMEKTGHRTLPQIFIDGKFIGGYTELKAYFLRG